MKTTKSYYVALYGIMFATIFVAMMIDRLFSFLQVFSFAACVLLVTFSFMFARNEWSTALLAGTFFGVASLLKEIFMPSALAPYLSFWEYPLVFLLPRVAVGAVGFSVYRLMQKLLQKMKSAYARQTVAITTATLFGLVTNTLLFLSAAFLLCRDKYAEYSSVFGIIGAVFVSNVLPEYLVSLILTPHLVLGVRKAMHWGLEPNYLTEEISQ